MIDQKAVTHAILDSLDFQTGDFVGTPEYFICKISIPIKTNEGKTILTIPIYLDILS